MNCFYRKKLLKAVRHLNKLYILLNLNNQIKLSIELSSIIHLPVYFHKLIILFGNYYLIYVKSESINNYNNYQWKLYLFYLIKKLLLKEDQITNTSRFIMF